MNTTIAKIIEKMNGKSRYYLIAAVLITLLVFAGLLWYILKSPGPAVPQTGPAENEMEEIIKSLSAPEGTAGSLPKGVQKSISAPKQGGKPSEDILKSLSAPK